MIINCVVIEDEPLAMERLKSYIQKVRFLNLLQTFDDPLESIRFKLHAR